MRTFAGRRVALFLVLIAAWLSLARLCGAAAEESVQGTVKRLLVPQGRLTVIDATGKEWLFVLDPHIRVHFRGKATDLREIQAGWSVTVRYEPHDDDLLATALDALPPSPPREQPYRTRAWHPSPPDDSKPRPAPAPGKEETVNTTQESAIVQVFYATDRAPIHEHMAAWKWYLSWFHPALTALALTGALALLARWTGRRGFRRLAIVGAVATCYFLGSGFGSSMRGTGGLLSPEELYGNERSNEVQFGTCAVSVPRLHQLGTLESPTILRFEIRFDPAKHVTLQAVVPCPDTDFYARVRACVERSERGEAFVFIHGYNVSFADAARRTAQLAYDLEFEGAPILFSWPSQGGMLQYTIDESNAEWAIPDLEQFLRQLGAATGARRIHLIAHSMGNRVLTQALRALAAEHSSEIAVFRELILAAPDIDADTFRRSIAPAIRHSARRITLYASSHDEALVASKQLHGYARAGESGEHLVVIPGMDTIDVSTVDTSFIGHSYYGDNRTLLSDLYSLLHRGLPPAKRTFLDPADHQGSRYWIFNASSRDPDNRPSAKAEQELR